MTATASITIPELSRKHRTWIALYSLEAGVQSRESIMRLNNVTEEDLRVFEESWHLMRTRRSASPESSNQS